MSYSDEEKEAIEAFKNYINAIYTFGTISPKCCNNLYGPAAIILNLIQEQEKEMELLKHRLDVANEYIESRIDNMIPEHYDDLKYIINECDLDSTW
jgi:hypothetical protein